MGRGQARARVVREARPAHESPLAAALASADTGCGGDGPRPAGDDGWRGLPEDHGQRAPVPVQGRGAEVGVSAQRLGPPGRAASRRRPEGNYRRERFFALLADGLEDAAA